MWPSNKKLILTAELKDGHVEALSQTKGGMEFVQWSYPLPDKDKLDRQMMLAMMGEMYHLIGPNGLDQMYREVMQLHGNPLNKI